MQIALFVTPFLVVLGWIWDIPMTLSNAPTVTKLRADFQIFQVVIIFVSVVFAAYLIMDGISNWMKGAMLVGVYGIIAISCYFYPDTK
jgi:Ca2+:H+ antiporter